MIKRTMRPNPPLPELARGVTLALSLLAAAAAVLLLLSANVSTPLESRSRADALVLISASAVASVVLYAVRRDVVSRSLLTARLVMAILAGIPLGPLVPVKIALWSSLVLEASCHLRPPAQVPAVAAIIVTVLAFQQRFRVWGVPIAAPEAPLLAAAGAWLTGLACLAVGCQRLVAMVGREQHTAARLDEAVRQITAANLGFQKVASSAQEQSAEDERKRITRDIHDSIGYALTNLIMMLEAAIRLAPGEESRLRKLLAQAREEAQLGLNETRRVLRVMRAAAPETIQGLSAIHRLVTMFGQATGVEVRVEYCNADRSFGKETDETIYRMVQEGLTNAFRHGRATLIRLSFWQDEHDVRVNLWDNGNGGEVVTEGIGLSGMRERIESAGGTLRFGRAADGFELCANIPVAGTERQGHDFLGTG